jgi:hypothetical protein
MFTSTLTFADQLEIALQRYEDSVKSYWIKSNQQRIFQLFMAKRILALLKKSQITAEQARLLLYALMESIQEASKHLGRGSLLKKLLKEITIVPHKPRDIYYAQETEQTRQQKADEARTLTASVVSLHPVLQAKNAFLLHLTKVKIREEAYQTELHALNPRQYQQLKEESIFIAEQLHKSLMGTPQEFIMSEAELQVKDFFTSASWILPLKLIKDHAKNLHELLLAQIKKQLLATDYEKVQSYLLALLPQELHADYLKFISTENFLDPEIFKKYTDEHFAQTYISERYAAPEGTESLTEAVRKFNIFKSQATHVLKAIFILSAQFGLEQSTFLQEAQFTDFESLMGYVLSASIVIKPSIHPELARQRQECIAEYLSLVEQKKTIFKHIQEILLDQGYFVDAIKEDNLLDVLTTLITPPHDSKKQEILKLLHTINPETLQTPLQAFKACITEVQRLKDKAVHLVAQTLKLSIAEEAKTRGHLQAEIAVKSIIKNILKNSVLSEIRQYFEKLVMHEVAKILHSKQKGSDIRTDEERLKKEREALQEALKIAGEQLQKELGAQIVLNWKLLQPIEIPTATADTLPTVTFDTSGITLASSAYDSVFAFNTLLTKLPAQIKNKLASVFPGALKAGTTVVARFERGQIAFLDVADTMPAAITYKLAGNLGLPASSEIKHLARVVQERDKKIIEVSAEVATLAGMQRELLTLVRDDTQQIKKCHEHVVEAKAALAEGVESLSRTSSEATAVPIPSTKISKPGVLPPGQKRLQVQELLKKLIEQLVASYYRQKGGNDPQRRQYAQEQVMKKFAGIIKTIEFKENNPNISIDFDPDQETLNEYYQRIKKLLNQNNRYFWSRWHSSNTAQMLDSLVKSLATLKDSSQALFKLDAANNLILITSKSEAQKPVSTPAVTFYEYIYASITGSSTTPKSVEPPSTEESPTSTSSVIAAAESSGSIAGPLYGHLRAVQQDLACAQELPSVAEREPCNAVAPSMTLTKKIETQECVSRLRSFVAMPII